MREVHRNRVRLRGGVGQHHRSREARKPRRKKSYILRLDHRPGVTGVCDGKRRRVYSARQIGIVVECHLARNLSDRQVNVRREVDVAGEVGFVDLYIAIADGGCAAEPAPRAAEVLRTAHYVQCALELVNVDCVAAPDGKRTATSQRGVARLPVKHADIHLAVRRRSASVLAEEYAVGVQRSVAGVVSAIVQRHVAERGIDVERIDPEKRGVVETGRRSLERERAGEPRRLVEVAELDRSRAGDVARVLLAIEKPTTVAIDAERAIHHKNKLIEYDRSNRQYNPLLTMESQKITDPYTVVNKDDDAIKELNILCKNAKINTIRDKQLDERKMMEDMYKKKEGRLDLMMELERLKEIKFKEAQEQEIKKLNKEANSIIIDQILDNERVRIKKREQIEKEKIQMRMQIEKLEEEEKKRILHEKQVREKRVQECLKVDQYAILMKQKKKIEEKEEELRDKKYNEEKARREEEYLKEMKWTLSVQKEIMRKLKEKLLRKKRKMKSSSIEN